MQTIRNRLIYLHRIREITRKMLHRIEKQDPTLQLIFTLTPAEIAHCFHITIEKSTTIYHQLHDSAHLKAMIKKDAEKIMIITKEDNVYPDNLRHIPDAPFVLYMIGDTSILTSAFTLSVIGTRKPSDQAYTKVKQIVEPLIQADWVIVSGLAYGIDSYAHQLTVENKGKTVAVLGSGFYHIYPKAHTDLCKKIVRNGLMISEYPPDTKPKRHHFPERNRIISGLSESTLVIEAKERSGTMITVDQALEQGKDIFAVPGSPLTPETQGCNRLIQEGAKLVTKTEDIIDEWPVIFK